MSGEYLTIDRAYWHPAIFDAAGQVGARAIRGYAFDHYLNDVDGYCGGWTPAVIAEIYARGYDFGPIYVFRDGEQQPDPARCVEVLAQLGVRPGAWVHDDLEGGAMDRLDHAVGLSQALRTGGYHPAPYGTASTLNQGYLSYADGAWVARYLGRPWNEVPPLQDVDWVGSWDYIGWQYANSNQIAGVDVDVSIVNFPIGGKGGAVPKSPPFFVKVNAGARWYGTPQEGTANQPQPGDPGGITFKVIEVASQPDHFYYKTDTGSWWLRDVDAVEVPAPTPVPTPTPTPAAVVDLTPILTRLDDLKVQLAGIAQSAQAAADTSARIEAAFKQA